MFRDRMGPQIWTKEFAEMETEKRGGSKYAGDLTKDEIKCYIECLNTVTPEGCRPKSSCQNKQTSFEFPTTTAHWALLLAICVDTNQRERT